MGLECGHKFCADCAFSAVGEATMPCTRSLISRSVLVQPQEAMYQPLGLECGHKFCADCAFSAVGKGNALGTVRAILDHVDPEAACPECRTKGVYVRAISSVSNGS